MANYVTHSHLRVRALTEGAIMLALAVVVNYLSGMIFASLPQGGSITLAMFPLLFYVHRWGLGRGFLICFAYGTLDMLLGKGYAWGWQSILLDYTVAYGMVGLAGVCRKLPHGLAWGAVVGGLARFVIHYISGVTIYAILAPTELFGITFLSPWFYSLAYNLGYVLPSTILVAAVCFFLEKPLEKLPQ